VIAKSFLAAYVSLYLVLPGCLCQVLSAFGIELSHVAIVEVGEPSVSANGPAQPGPVCHCHEDLSKVAEVVEDRSQEIPVLSLNGSAFATQAPALFPADESPGLHSRGPPGPAAWTSAPRSGVFLI